MSREAEDPIIEAKNGTFDPKVALRAGDAFYLEPLLFLISLTSPNATNNEGYYSNDDSGINWNIHDLNHNTSGAGDYHPVELFNYLKSNIVETKQLFLQLRGITEDLQYR